MSTLALSVPLHLTVASTTSPPRHRWWRRGMTQKTAIWSGWDCQVVRLSGWHRGSDQVGIVRLSGCQVVRMTQKIWSGWDCRAPRRGWCWARWVWQTAAAGLALDRRSTGGKTRRAQFCVFFFPVLSFMTNQCFFASPKALIMGLWDHFKFSLGSATTPRIISKVSVQIMVMQHHAIPRNITFLLRKEKGTFWLDSQKVFCYR